MAYVRIYDLTDEPIVSTSWRVAIDDLSFADTHSCTILALLEPEATVRENNDDTIAAAVGLDANYAYDPIETSNYITSKKFVDAGLTASHRSADELLDAKIFELEGSLFLRLIFSLTNAQLLAINATPVTIYAAIGGYVFNLINLMGKHVYAAAAFVTGGDDLTLQMNGVTIGTIDQAAFVATEDFITRGVVLEDYRMRPTMAITVTAGSDYTTGGGIATVRCVFELVGTGLGAVTAVGGCCNQTIKGSFVTADLAASKLVIAHNYNTEFMFGVMITEDDGSGTMYPFTLGDAAGLDKPNNITIDFTGIPITNTWTYSFVVIIF